MSGSPHAPEITTIGKYQLIANLGHGGMADVYLAIVHGLVGFNKLTVIKRLRPSLAEEPEFLAMFLDEARLAARLNHPNVVQTNEVAEVDGVYFIAMEYLDGQPLNRILHRLNKQENPPRLALLRVVADALAGLHHAHELADYDGSPLHVVHRDASPHNIFVTYEGQTKVVDFGIAKAATRSTETRGGVLKGKIAYMAPEQSRSGEVDRRADVFAMGLVLWEVVIGARLRKGTDVEMLDKMAQGDVPALSSVWPGCPSALERIVGRSTALRPEDRYATAQQMRQEILDYLDTCGTRSTQEDVGKLVSGLFESKREEMRAIIERQLSGLRRASTGEVSLRMVDVRKLAATDSMEVPRVSMPSSQSHPGIGSAPSAVTGDSLSDPGTGVSGSTATPTLASPAAPNRFRAVFVLAGVVVGAAVAMLVLQRAPSAPAGEPPAPTAIVSAPESKPAPGPSVTPKSVETSDRKVESTIELAISVKPEQAKMFLDDAALTSNPFVGRFRKDDQPHTLRITADGYTSELRSISFTSDQKVDVVLSPAQPPAGGAAPASEPTRAPDDDAMPTPTARPKRQLDTDDPWK